MIRLLYTIVYSLGFVLLSPMFLYKMWKRGKYRENFFQRFGFYSPETRRLLALKTGQRCWIQAVSVGEVNVALVFIAALQRNLPQVRAILTTTTSTGHMLARERLPKEVELVYFPQDFGWCVRRAYDLIQPDFIVLMESEVWPNHIWEGDCRNVPVFLVNARMSPRSARRYRRVQWLFRTVFDRPRLVCAQSREDADNFRFLGVPTDRIHMTGNFKYDASLPQAAEPTFDPAQVLKEFGIEPARPILVAGSTHPGEEAILFDMLQELGAAIPDLFLVLVPRHVERAPEIVELAKKKNITLALRTEAVRPPSAPCQCLLVNTTGELRWFYNLATVIFVGKSLMGQGGQNIVEAAASGHPVVFGPHMQNFKAIAEQFVAEGACVQVNDVYELQRALVGLLQDEQHRKKIADAACRVIEANIGATARTVELIAAALK